MSYGLLKTSIVFLVCIIFGLFNQIYKIICSLFWREWVILTKVVWNFWRKRDAAAEGCEFLPSEWEPTALATGPLPLPARSSVWSMLWKNTVLQLSEVGSRCVTTQCLQYCSNLDLLRYFPLLCVLCVADCELMVGLRMAEELGGSEYSWAISYLAVSSVQSPLIYWSPYIVTVGA